MIALLARKLVLTLFLAFLFVAVLEQFNPTPPQMVVDFHRADFQICVPVHNGPIERATPRLPYQRKSDTA